MAVTSQARYSQTARIRGKTFREAVQAKGGCLRVAAYPACGVETRRKRWRVLRLGTGRSTAFVAASEKIFRNVEAKLRPSTHALERARKGGSANPLHRRRL